jgi:hypothetical protein
MSVKTGSKSDQHRLVDVEERAARFATFEIPSREEREDLWPGDLAKLIFADIGERIWVEVVDVLDAVYVGTVESSPLHSELHRGDEIVFQPENVADISRRCVPGFDRPSRKRNQGTLPQ